MCTGDTGQSLLIPAAAGEAAEESNSWMSTLTLGALFGLWYLFNIWFNM